MTSGPVRIGFLGSGYMARTHAQHLKALGGVEIAAVCGSSQAAAEAWREEAAPEAQAYGDFATMLDEARLDALYVCVPPFAHDQQVVQAARRGIHLFLEKPVALHVAAALEMAKAVEDTGVKVQVGYHLRARKAIAHLKELVENGTAGKPTLFQGWWHCNALHSEWWRHKNKSGGQVFEQAIHVYDLALHLCGMPQTIWAQLANLNHQEPDDYTVEDTSVGMIRFENGALGTVTASNNAIPGEWRTGFTLICTRLTATLSHDGRMEIVDTSDPENVKREIVDPDDGDDPYREENRRFLALLHGEEPSLAPMLDGLAGVALVSTVQTSAEMNGRAVRFSLEGPPPKG